MPRANRHIISGHSYHVTHRCHDRAFLLRFGCDRQMYRDWMRQGLSNYRVDLLTYCITSNHVHLLLQANSTDDLAGYIQYVHGNAARAYNSRKNRTGAFWSDRYHATMVEGGTHLWRCLKYIDLNMVRAGAVAHPSQWEWTGWKELMGQRKRNRLISIDKLLQSLGTPSVANFRDNYLMSIDEALTQGRLRREACWSESIAVGSHTFVQAIEDELRTDYTRRQMTQEQNSPDNWTLKESHSSSYGSKNDPENRSISGYSGCVVSKSKCNTGQSRKSGPAVRSWLPNDQERIAHALSSADPRSTIHYLCT